MTCFINWFIVNTLLKKPSQQRPSLMSLYFSEVLQKHSKGKLDVSRQWLFGPSDSYDFGDPDRGDPSPYVTPCAKNLGVLFDSGLKFDKQINAFVKSCFYHLRRLAKVKTVLSLKELWNSYPRIYYFMPWLLQFTLLWSKSIIYQSSSNSTKCCS